MAAATASSSSCFKASFRTVKPIKPKASRDKSAETFLVGIGLKPLPIVGVDQGLRRAETDAYTLRPWGLPGGGGLAWTKIGRRCRGRRGFCARLTVLPEMEPR